MEAIRYSQSFGDQPNWMYLRKVDNYICKHKAQYYYRSSDRLSTLFHQLFSFIEVNNFQVY